MHDLAHASTTPLAKRQRNKIRLPKRHNIARKTPPDAWPHTVDMVEKTSSETSLLENIGSSNLPDMYYTTVSLRSPCRPRIRVPPWFCSLLVAYAMPFLHISHSASSYSVRCRTALASNETTTILYQVPKGRVRWTPGRSLQRRRRFDPLTAPEAWEINPSHEPATSSASFPESLSLHRNHRESRMFCILS
jgi:hypothetical protein